jgi:hypothetical protein
VTFVHGVYKPRVGRGCSCEHLLDLRPQIGTSTNSFAREIASSIGEVIPEDVWDKLIGTGVRTSVATCHNQRAHVASELTHSINHFTYHISSLSHGESKRWSMHRVVLIYIFRSICRHV